MAEHQDMSHKSVKEDVEGWSVLPDTLCPHLVQATVTKYHRQVTHTTGSQVSWFWQL